VNFPEKYYKYQIITRKCNPKVIIGEKNTLRGIVPVKATTKFLSYINFLRAQCETSSDDNAQHEILNAHSS
jgi:hypothetical protein